MYLHPSLPSSSFPPLSLHLFFCLHTLTQANDSEPSWGDDLESLGYMLVYMIKGTLPWGTPRRMIHDEFTDRMQEAEEAGKIKLAMSPEEICADLPREFATFLGYAQSLPYGARPDYAYLRRLFRRLFQRRGFRYDNVYEWTEKIFHEMEEGEGEEEEEEEEGDNESKGEFV